jgi:hypothetical protein
MPAAADSHGVGSPRWGLLLGGVSEGKPLRSESTGAVQARQSPLSTTMHTSYRIEGVC